MSGQVEKGKRGCKVGQVTKNNYLNSNTGSHGDLLEEIREMIDVLKHSETHILKTDNETAHVRVMAV